MIEIEPVAKQRFHQTAQALLKQVAMDLGLSPNEYDLRSNQGGAAVSGEITLHSDRLYAQLSKYFNQLRRIGKKQEGGYDACQPSQGL